MPSKGGIGLLLGIGILVIILAGQLSNVANSTTGQTTWKFPTLIIIDSNTLADSGLTMGFNGAYPATLSEGGICFPVPSAMSGQRIDSWSLRQVKFNMVVAAGAPSGTFQAILFPSTGTIGNNCQPSGGASLASSNTQTISAISGYTPFFTFNTPYFQLQPGTIYAISLRITACTLCNSTNYWLLEYINTNSAINDNIYYWNNPYGVGGPNSKLQYELDGDPISITAVNEASSPGLIPIMLILPLVYVGFGIALILGDYLRKGEVL